MEVAGRHSETKMDVAALPFKKKKPWNNLAANTIWPSRSSQDVFSFPFTSLDRLFNYYDFCTVSITATEVLHCRHSAQLPQRHFGPFFPVCFVLTRPFFVSFFFFPVLHKDCERTERESSLTLIVFEIKIPYCRWQGLMWIGSGRCGKRFPSDCDGLTVVIVMMHLLWFFLFPTTLEKKW